MLGRSIARLTTTLAHLRGAGQALAVRNRIARTHTRHKLGREAARDRIAPGNFDNGASVPIGKHALVALPASSTVPHVCKDILAIGVHSRHREGTRKANALLVRAAVLRAAVLRVGLPAAVLKGHLVVVLLVVHMRNGHEREAHKAAVVVVARVDVRDLLAARPRRDGAVAVVLHRRARGGARLTRARREVRLRVHAVEVRAARGAQHGEHSGDDGGGGSHGAGKRGLDAADRAVALGRGGL